MQNCAANIDTKSFQMKFRAAAECSNIVPQNWKNVMLLLSENGEILLHPIYGLQHELFFHKSSCGQIQTGIMESPICHARVFSSPYFARLVDGIGHSTQRLHYDDA